MSKCILCLRSLPIFDGLAMEDFKNVCLNASKITLKKGDFLFCREQAADTIYLIKEGIIKLAQCTEEGKEIILDIVGRGNVLGEMALFKKQKHLSDAVALEEVHVCAFSLSQFETLIKNKPNIALSVIANLGQKLYSAMQQLSDTANYSVEDKLLALFFRLAKEYGKETSSGQLIELNLTQQDMANMIGASRVMVAQVIKKFKEAGFLTKQGRYYVLKDQCLNTKFINTEAL
ncbi:Crp/Fnr family transcriptional regulator [Metallumcola ferriviriculae]|uniref:Crp/Fnr family transcriptional regulator n=1 Tax=Metallumcola ferriviriculae TaxID=3039180 RepID=A0AAU0UNA7_9FIRM|nr:Crp/Fnr family transcriptional regulator [Desulfitibacteraceae bacterium MK1]